MAVTGTPPRLTLGTIEQVPIQLTDTLGNLDDLSGHDLRYDLYWQADMTAIITNAACSNDGMLALPLIDTTDLDEGYYLIFINFTNGSEEVRKGPFRILIDD